MPCSPALEKAKIGERPEMPVIHRNQNFVSYASISALAIIRTLIFRRVPD